MAMETPAIISRDPAGDDDRLSELPDCLLEDVLSRLTSLQAARTSTLSRRWRHLWPAVASRVVDIDHREFWSREDELATPHIDLAGADHRTCFLLACEEQLRRRLLQAEKLEDLVDSLLPPPHHPHHDAAPPQLDTLRLRVACGKAFRGPARRWIRRGLGRRPATFHLRCDNDYHLAPADEWWPYFPGIITLPRPRRLAAFACRLRTMRLSGLTLSDDFEDCLAADFMALEDLQLEDCTLEFRRLASRSLRMLSMDRCRWRLEDNVAPAIAAPSIVSLRLDGDLPPVTVEGDMPALVAASLTRRCSGRVGSHLLIRSLRHVRSLSLSGFSTAALLGDDEDPVEFPVFDNLRTLLLDGCDVGVECQVLRRFLRNAPSLETLTLCDCAFSGGSRSRKRKKRWSGEKTSFSSDQMSYECRNLKSIELEFCDGHAVDELAQALVGGITKEMVEPIESSVRDGKRKVRISYT